MSLFLVSERGNDRKSVCPIEELISRRRLLTAIDILEHNGAGRRSQTFLVGIWISELESNDEVCGKLL